MITEEAELGFAEIEGFGDYPGFHPTTLQRFEYYNINDDDVDLFFGSTWTGQTFTPQQNHTLMYVKVKVAKRNNPGDVVVRIRATNAITGLPTGPDLSTGSILESRLTDYPSSAWVQVDMTSYVLHANTKYALILNAPGSDVNNSVGWAQDETSPTYTRGNKVISANGGATWTNAVNNDMMFEEWGQ